MQKDLTDIQATGTQVIGISYDSVETLKSFSEKTNIAFPLLSDEGSKTIKAYGIHNKEGYPYPGTYLLDKSGIVRAAFFVEGVRVRHESAELIGAAKVIE